jgi:hypothetical protein
MAQEARQAPYGQDWVVDSITLWPKHGKYLLEGTNLNRIGEVGERFYWVFSISTIGNMDCRYKFTDDCRFLISQTS